MINLKRYNQYSLVGIIPIGSIKKVVIVVNNMLKKLNYFVRITLKIINKWKIFWFSTIKLK